MHELGLRPMMRTRWADELDPERPLPGYPRPQLVRSRWTNLNGRWEASVDGPGEAPAFTETILVPFPAGSQLSGLDHVLQPDEVLTVRRRFVAPPLEPHERLRLHFGAVDWACEVHVNGHSIGSHRGGFDPFHLDILDAIIDADEQELVVSVTDPTDTGDQPLGKQSLDPFLYDLEVRLGPRRRRQPPTHAQRRAAVPPGPPRPGLVARRAVHRAHR